jgi:Carboxylesterase family
LQRKIHRYHQNEILATVVNEYTDWERPVQHPINIRDETMEALGDAQVVAPLVRTGDFHSVSRPTNSFFYVFDYQTKFGDFPQVRQKYTSAHGVDSLCVCATRRGRIFHSWCAACGVSAGRAAYFLIWVARARMCERERARVFSRRVRARDIFGEYLRSFQRVDMCGGWDDGAVMFEQRAVASIPKMKRFSGAQSFFQRRLCTPPFVSPSPDLHLNR